MGRAGMLGMTDLAVACAGTVLIPHPRAGANEVAFTAGTELYGRCVYEAMTFWEDARHDPALTPVAREWAEVWAGLDKVVYSSGVVYSRYAVRR